MDWILASASPRRKELLKEIVPAFEILPSHGEEIVDGNLSPKELVKALAKQKASEVALLPQAKGKIVLGADTVVALQGKILGKPADKEEAFSMISALSGKMHEVYTGVCILCPTSEGGRVAFTEADCTKVYFFELEKEKIFDYIATGSPMDKAGAYGIQDGGLVERIEGSFSNVVGLPTELCKKMVEEVEEYLKYGTRR